MNALVGLTKMLVVSVLGVFAAVIALLYFTQDSLIFPAPQGPSPSSLAPGFALVSIPTPDGETLSAYHHPAEDGEATIIVFHGNGDTAANQIVKGSALADAGFGVLLAGYRGYSGSTGRPSEQGLLMDGRASYDFVRAHGAHPIGLYAHSLGTGVAVPLAVERDVFAIVLESPFDSLKAVAQRRFPLLPVGALLRHRFLSDQIIGSVAAPILMMHGDNDAVLPMAHGKTLLEAAPPGTVFKEIAGAGHNDLMLFGTIEEAVIFFQDTFASYQSDPGGR